MDLDAVEAKFQLSVRVKAWDNIFGDNGALWFAYTQQSNWQVYNVAHRARFARPTTNPRRSSFRTDADLLGWRWRLLNFGLVHQSNGRSDPLSRSWNRVYAQFGLERGDFTLLVKPWYRLPESADNDDNPDIQDYLGRASCVSSTPAGTAFGRSALQLLGQCPADRSSNGRSRWSTS